MPDLAGGKDPQTGRFLPGNSGNGGRPKGSRNKLGEDFLSALQKDFAEHGVGTIERVRQERPQDYLKVIASLMPKDFNINVNPAEELSDDELVARIRQLTAAAAPFLTPDGTGDAADGVPKATAH